MKTAAAAMETSAAVPTRTELSERGLAELSDEDLLHLAEVMVRVWRHENRIGLLTLVLPVAGCGVLLSLGGSGLVGEAIGLGSLGLLTGAMGAGIAGVLLKRSVEFEAESLGYDKQVVRAVARAFQRSKRTFLPRLTRQRRLEECKKQLGRERAYSLPSRE